MRAAEGKGALLKFWILSLILGFLSTSCSSLTLRRDTEPVDFLSAGPRIKHLVLVTMAGPGKSFALAISSEQLQAN